MIPMERTTYQTEIRELTNSLTSLSYELDSCADDLWKVIGNGETADMEFLSGLCRKICSVQMSVKRELAKITVRRDIRNALAEVWEKMEEKNGTDTRATASADDSGEVVQATAKEVFCSQESERSGECQKGRKGTGRISRTADEKSGTTEVVLKQ